MTKADTAPTWSRRFARSHQIAQRLVGCVGHPGRRQFSGPTISRKFQRIPPIRLHPIPGFHRHQGGCHHLVFRSHPRQLPVQRVACRTRLITKPPLFHRPPSLHQLPNRFFAIRYHPQRPNLPVLLRHGYGRAARSPDCARAAASLPNAYAASDFTSKPGGES